MSEVDGRSFPDEGPTIVPGAGGVSGSPGQGGITDRGTAGPSTSRPAYPDEGETLLPGSGDAVGYSGVDGVGSLGDRFELMGQLGAGGMGVVYKARDRRLDREVAVKRLRVDPLESRQLIDRFELEARTVATLEHPNIVRIYDVLEDGAGLAIVMELLDGGSLQQRIEMGGAIPAEDVARIGVQLCDALELAHARGIVHRDIKPGNVLLTRRGMPKLADFGLAVDRSANQDARHTVTGSLLGTLHYAAPEQLADGKRVDVRADIYSVGATLYAASTGSSPRTVRLNKVPDSLRSIVERCLEENPQRRYQSAAELAEDLRRRCSLSSPKSEFPEEIERLIAAASMDGVLTMQEQAVLLRKAEALGLDRDAFQASLSKRMERLGVRSERAGRPAAPGGGPERRGRCPSCGDPFRGTPDLCPACAKPLLEDCPECGAQSHCSDANCTRCGTNIAERKAAIASMRVSQARERARAALRRSEGDSKSPESRTEATLHKEPSLPPAAPPPAPAATSPPLQSPSQPLLQELDHAPPLETAGTQDPSRRPVSWIKRSAIFFALFFVGAAAIRAFLSSESETVPVGTPEFIEMPEGEVRETARSDSREGGVAAAPRGAAGPPFRSPDALASYLNGGASRGELPGDVLEAVLLAGSPGTERLLAATVALERAKAPAYLAIQRTFASESSRVLAQSPILALIADGAIVERSSTRAVLRTSAGDISLRRDGGLWRVDFDRLLGEVMRVEEVGRRAVIAELYEKSTSELLDESNGLARRIIASEFSDFASAAEALAKIESAVTNRTLARMFRPSRDPGLPTLGAKDLFALASQASDHRQDGIISQLDLRLPEPEPAGLRVVGGLIEEGSGTLLQGGEVGTPVLGFWQPDGFVTVLLAVGPGQSLSPDWPIEDWEPMLLVDDQQNYWAARGFLRAEWPSRGASGLRGSQVEVVVNAAAEATSPASMLEIPSTDRSVTTFLVFSVPRDATVEAVMRGTRQLANAEFSIPTSLEESKSTLANRIRRRGEDEAASNGVDSRVRSGSMDVVLELPGGASIDLVWIAPGSFTMGAPRNDPGRMDWEHHASPVQIRNGFWIGRTEVTQAQWVAVMGSGTGSRSRTASDRLPVTAVSWAEAMQFCRKLSEAVDGFEFMLPTEAQWEYACRAGTSSSYSFGGRASQLADHAWFSSNSGGALHSAATREPNPWGLYDMHGNVWEWCTADGEVASGVHWMRGGAFDQPAQAARSAARMSRIGGETGASIGFRVVARSIAGRDDGAVLPPRGGRAAPPGPDRSRPPVDRAAVRRDLAMLKNFAAANPPLCSEVGTYSGRLLEQYGDALSAEDLLEIGTSTARCQFDTLAGFAFGLLMQKYPDSPLAEIAQRRLEKLSSR